MFGIIKVMFLNKDITEGVMRNQGIKQLLIVFTLTLSCLLFVFHHRLSAAENTGKESNVFTLGEIEVRDKTEINKNTTVEKISSKEMEEFSRDRLPDALNLIPGVTVTGGGRRNEKGIYVRGFGPSRVPVFLDGIPIYVPYDRTFDYDRFITFDLSEIVVSKGFTSVLYGPNTMGGAINMVSKKPVKPFEGNAGAGFGSGNTYYGYTNVGTNQKKWYLQAGASYYNRDYYPMSSRFSSTTRQGGSERKKSYSEDEKVNFKVGFTPFEGHEYAFGYINQQGEKGSPPDVRPNGDNKFWLWPKWDKETYYLTTNTPLGDKSYVKARLYYDKFENRLDFFTDSNYSIPDRSFGERSYYDDWTVGGSIEGGTTFIPRNNLKAAFHYKRDTHKERNRVGADGATEPWQRSDDLIMSFGIEDTIDITKKFYAIAGVSYDRIEGLRAREWIQDKKGQPCHWFNFLTDTVTSWNPQLGLFYLVSDTGKLHASVAKKTRAPSMKEKFSGGFGTKLANPGLEPEESINYEIGYEDVFQKKLRVKTTVFYNDITDAIISYKFTAGPNAGMTQNQNLGRVKQYGIEAEGIISITKDLEGGLNYTYLDRNNATPSSRGPSAFTKMTDVPEHKFFSYAKYMTPFLDGLSLFGSLEYNTYRWSSDNDKAGCFALVNLKASYNIKKGLTVEAGVNNLFDRYYEYTVGYPEPGRILFANMRYSF